MKHGWSCETPKQRVHCNGSITLKRSGRPSLIPDVEDLMNKNQYSTKDCCFKIHWITMKVILFHWQKFGQIWRPEKRWERPKMWIILSFGHSPPSQTWNRGKWNTIGLSPKRRRDQKEIPMQAVNYSKRQYKDGERTPKNRAPTELSSVMMNRLAQDILKTEEKSNIN